MHFQLLFIHAFTPGLRAEGPVGSIFCSILILGVLLLLSFSRHSWHSAGECRKSAETEGINCQKAEAAKTTSPLLCFFLHPKRTMIHRSELALLVMGFLKNEREAFPETLKCFLREAGDLGESSRRAWQLLVSTAALYAAETALALLGC